MKTRFIKKIQNAIFNPALISNRVCSCFRFCFLLFLLLTFVYSTHAQDQATKRGFTPGNSFAISDFESVNTTNGNVTMSFPLAKLPVGRNGLTAGLFLVYNSKLYDTEIEYFDNYNTNCQTPGGCYYQKQMLKVSQEGGWHYTSGYYVKVEDRTLQYTGLPYSQQPQCSTQPNLLVYRYKVHVVLPDGSQHEMIPYGYNDANEDRYYNVNPDGSLIQNCGGSPSQVSRPVYYSVDGTFLRMEYGSNDRWALYFPDGSYYDFGDYSDEENLIHPRVYDRNNNYVEFRPGQIIDEFGRSITTGYDTQTEEDTITVKGVGGDDLVWRVKWKSIYVNKKYMPYSNDMWPDCTYTHSCPPTTDPESIDKAFGVIDYIKLPSQADNLIYTFSYNAFDAPPDPEDGESEVVPICETRVCLR